MFKARKKFTSIPSRVREQEEATRLLTLTATFVSAEYPKHLLPRFGYATVRPWAFRQGCNHFKVSSAFFLRSRRWMFCGVGLLRGFGLHASARAARYLQACLENRPSHSRRRCTSMPVSLILVTTTSSSMSSTSTRHLRIHGLNEQALLPAQPFLFCKWKP